MHVATSVFFSYRNPPGKERQPVQPTPTKCKEESQEVDREHLCVRAMQRMERSSGSSCRKGYIRVSTYPFQQPKECQHSKQVR